VRCASSAQAEAARHRDRALTDLDASRRRASRPDDHCHRNAGVANTSTIAVAASTGAGRCTPPAHSGIPLDQCAKTTPVARVWEALRTLHDDQISHGDLRSHEITVDDGAVLFGASAAPNYGATGAHSNPTWPTPGDASALYDASPR